MAFLGVGGAGAAAVKTVLNASAVDARVGSLETRQTATEKKVDTISDTLSRLDEKSERAEADRKEILSILRGRQ
jgi:uncharacterized coiled-coil protein SlyX